MKRILATTWAVFCAIVAPAAAVEKPNIVLLFADDAGYADFGFQGSKELRTPCLDHFAAQGTRFTQAYVSDATCGPSRAGLLTGKYQQRFGYEENNVPGYMSSSSAQLGAEMGIPVGEKTMADYLKGVGYKSGFFGKWHVGGADRYHPTKRGFDEFVGFRGGARSYFAYQDGQTEDPLNKLERGFGEFVEPKGYLTDVLADETMDFIERNQEGPFFAFVSFNAVHTPMDATKEDLAQFPELSGTRQELAAMTLALDRACGRILDKLDELGLEENTLVIFTNDNGGPSDRNASINRPLSGTKSNHLEGGIRVPFLMRWPGHVPVKADYDYPISTLDLLPTFFEAAGGEVAAGMNLDGVNLLPYITGLNKERPHSVLYWKRDVRGTIRDGDWKLMRFPDRPPELYNIAEDLPEHNNLAAEHPEKVKAMFKKLFAWEQTLERPLFMLKRQYEQYDLDRMDAYR